MHGADCTKPLRRSLRQSEKLKAKSLPKPTSKTSDKVNRTNVAHHCNTPVESYLHHNLPISDMCPDDHGWSMVRNEISLRGVADKKSKCETDDPLLQLAGSEDLNFIPNHLLMTIVEIYDCCIRSRKLLRLAPFRFEDFCFCLIHQGQSPLLAELFLAYLRVLFIDNETNGITYFTPNERDSAYIFTNAVDNFTWVEAIKIYFSSSNNLLPLYRSIVSKAGFPMSSSIEEKVCLLKSLHSILIESTIFSSQFELDSTLGSFQITDKICRSCRKFGVGLEACSVCPSVYHKECLVNVRYEQEHLICSLCLEHSLNGLSCDDLYRYYNNTEDSLKPLGVDAFGRLYWFTLRRVFVEDVTGKVTYYSSVAALDKLLKYLSRPVANEAEQKYQQQLLENIVSLDVPKEVGRNSTIMKAECFTGYTSVYELDTIDIPSAAVVDRSTSAVSLKNSKFYLIGMNDGYLRYTNYYHYWSNENAALWHPNLSKKVYNSQLVYRDLPWYGGFDQLYKDVVELRKCNGATNRVVHEFAFLKLIQNTLLNIESVLPSPYLNPIWYHQLPAWAKCVRMASSPAKLAALILLFYHMIKPFSFQSSWYDSTGHILPCKIVCPQDPAKVDKSHKTKPNPVLVRNFQIYHLTRQYNEMDELMNVDVIVKNVTSSPLKLKSNSMPTSSGHKQSTTHSASNVFVKFKKPPPHRIWIQKGEEYRLTGEGSWYLINRATNPKETFQKLTQRAGCLDRVIETIGKRNNSLCAIAVNNTAASVDDCATGCGTGDSGCDYNPNITPSDDSSLLSVTKENHSSAVVIPSLAPVGASDNAQLSSVLRESKSTLAAAQNDYIPGEGMSKFFIRKGSQLLKSIEQGLISSRKPLVTSADTLMDRELKHFVRCRQLVSNVCDVLRVYRVGADERLRLGRKAGLCEVKGFNYNNSSYRSSSTQNWPICFPRPSIGRIWEIRMLSVTSIYDIAFLMKLLYTCLDHDNLNNSNSNDIRGSDEIVVGGVNLQTTPIYCSQVDGGIVTDEILNAKSISCDGLVYGYLVKRTVQPLSKLINNTNYHHLIDNNNLILNKDGEIDIVSKTKTDPISCGGGDDGRYVSSFRKNSVPPENLINDHVLRSSSSSLPQPTHNSATKLLYKHSDIEWMHENQVNTILIKRFWAKIEDERTRLQSEYTVLYKKWLQLATSKNLVTPTPTANPTLANQHPKLAPHNTIKTSTNQLSPAGAITTANITTNITTNVTASDGAQPPPAISNSCVWIPPQKPSLLLSSHPTNICSTTLKNSPCLPPKSPTVSPNINSIVHYNIGTSSSPSLSKAKVLKKFQEPLATSDMTYENMVIYQQAKEEKLRLGPKVDTLFGFKVEELLNVHAEYLKTNLRRNKTLANDPAATLPYQSYVDVRDRLNRLHSDGDFIIGKFLKSAPKYKNGVAPVTAFQSNFAPGDGGNFRRSNRAHKPKIPYEEYDYSDNIDAPRRATTTTSSNKPTRTSCCCSSVATSTDRTFVSCFGCGNVFHGVCYGMSKLKASVVSRFYCPSCELARDDFPQLVCSNSTAAANTLGCSCCDPVGQPRKVRNSDGDTVTCQLCTRLHHFDCINFPTENPSLRNYFVCDRCKTTVLERIRCKHSSSPLSLVGKRVLIDLVNHLQMYEVSSPFLLPVDVTVVNDYDTIVKTPMDLSTLTNNVKNNVYSSVADFVKDATLIFKNCRLYNSSETIYVKYANCLECVLWLKLHTLAQRSDISTSGASTK